MIEWTTARSMRGSAWTASLPVRATVFVIPSGVRNLLVPIVDQRMFRDARRERKSEFPCCARNDGEGLVAKRARG